MKKFLHLIYKLIGYLFNFIMFIYWSVRDYLFPIKSKAILFVAHPDDDTLFFHQFIKENNPYVILITTGWSLRRIPGFMKNMNEYGVRYRFYWLETNDTRKTKIKNIINKSLQLSTFSICATHNAEGEYGHEMHKRISECVNEVVNIPVLMPTIEEKMKEYRVVDNQLNEKIDKFNRFYSTELFVLEQYSFWMSHENLEEKK